MQNVERSQGIPISLDIVHTWPREDSCNALLMPFATLHNADCFTPHYIQVCYFTPGDIRVLRRQEFSISDRNTLLNYIHLKVYVNDLILLEYSISYVFFKFCKIDLSNS